MKTYKIIRVGLILSLCMGLFECLGCSLINSDTTAPSDLSATAVSTSQINLTWTNNSSALISINVERKTSEDGDWALIATVGSSVTAYSDTGLNVSTTYYYRVCGIDSSGSDASLCSDEAYATTWATNSGSWILRGQDLCSSCNLQVWIDGSLAATIGYGDINSSVGSYSGTHTIGVYTECSGLASPLQCFTVSPANGQVVWVYLDDCYTARVMLAGFSISGTTCP